MKTHSDAAWRALGETDPYFGVLSDPRFHREAMDDATIGEFFATGERHVERVLALVSANAPTDFTACSALDFGCGVGRIAIPLCRHFQTVTGIDVSPAMLEEASLNARRSRVSNFHTLSQLPPKGATHFDFIHSFIVFQHIPPRRGTRLALQALDLLSPTGIAVLHFTFARTTSMGSARRLLRNVPFASGLYNLYRGRPFAYPRIDMHCYNLNHLFRLLHGTGLHLRECRFVHHSDSLGAALVITRDAASDLA